MSDPAIPKNPPETNVEDEFQGLQEEYALLFTPGHARRLGWAELMYRKDSSRLALGEIIDDRERHQAEGRCQAFKMLIDRDGFITEAWQQHQADEEAKRQPEELEGGDYGVSWGG